MKYAFGKGHQMSNDSLNHDNGVVGSGESATATATPPRGVGQRNPDTVPTNSIITRDPFPASEKIYVTGSREDIRVPMREISMRPTRRIDGSLEENGKLRVYDTSGVYTDVK